MSGMRADFQVSHGSTPKQPLIKQPSGQLTTICPSEEIMLVPPNPVNTDGTEMALPGPNPADVTQSVVVQEPQVKTSRKIAARFCCEICGKAFSSRSKLFCHQQIHDNDRRLFYCPAAGCTRVYTSKQASELHYKQQHLDEGLVCPICCKIFVIPQTLEVHMRYHNKLFPFECELCKKKFAQKGHLTTHMQVKHNNLRYVCEIIKCGRVFKNSVSLRNHRFSHTGMPFTCAFCHKGFPQKGKLKVHISMNHRIDLTIEELESMRRFREQRTRHSLLQMPDVLAEEPEVEEAELEESKLEESEAINDEPRYQLRQSVDSIGDICVD